MIDILKLNVANNKYMVIFFILCDHALSNSLNRNL